MKTHLPLPDVLFLVTHSRQPGPGQKCGQRHNQGPQRLSKVATIQRNCLQIAVLAWTDGVDRQPMACKQAAKALHEIYDPISPVSGRIYQPQKGLQARNNAADRRTCVQIGVDFFEMRDDRSRHDRRVLSEAMRLSTWKLRRCNSEAPKVLLVDAIAGTHD